jgi:uncharacterized protein YvpB
MSIKHDIPFKIQSGSSNCVQTSTSQFLSFYGFNIPATDIEKKVPVRKNKEDKPMGTLLQDIGTWLVKGYQLKPVIHVFDSQIIDRSWKTYTQKQVLDKIVELSKTGIKTALSPYSPLHISAYVDFLKAGGKLNISKCTNDLLHKLLDEGPILAIISYNYMYDYPRVFYDKLTKKYIPDSVNGKVIEHAIVLTGYEGDLYFYNDPDEEFGGHNKKVKSDVLIGAICSAQINSDNYLLTL